jgi:putative ABC transport system ATP-binding protein
VPSFAFQQVSGTLEKYLLCALSEAPVILQIENLQKSFPHPGTAEPVQVLHDLNFQVQESDTVAIVGQSGSGKSTLLSLMAGLDTPSSGTLRLRGSDLATMSEEALTRFRAENIGIIFQQFHLMQHLTALENVALPLEMAGLPDAETRARKALSEVGLSHREDHFPHQMSGGECQRVAIARAIVIRPALLLADEPTGNLDHATGEQVANLLFDLVQRTGMTLVLVTHNNQLAERCERALTLSQGVLE